MAWGAVDEIPFDPKVATPFGDNFYPPQKDPGRTTLPAAPAPATLGNVWQAVRMTKMEDFSPENIAKIPCLKSSLMQGIGSGTVLAAGRYVIGPSAGLPKILQCYKWFVVGFIFIGGAANYRCFAMREEEMSHARLLNERFPDRMEALKAKARAEAEAKVAADIAVSKSSPSKIPSGPSQKIVALPPAKIAPTQNYVTVRDSDGEFMGRLNKQQVTLALERGGLERYEDEEGNRLGLVDGKVEVVERAAKRERTLPGGIFQALPAAAGEGKRKEEGFWKGMWG